MGCLPRISPGLRLEKEIIPRLVSAESIYNASVEKAALAFAIDMTSPLSYSCAPRAKFCMYRIIGTDQREYGPASADQLRAWILEGRLNGQSLARLDESVGWKPLSDFPEFVGVLAQRRPLPTYAGSVPGPAATNNGMALASLILGCLSLVCCTFAPVLSVVGLILGIVALQQARKDPVKGGRGLAIAGIAVSSAGIVLFALLGLLGAFQEIVRRLFK